VPESTEKELEEIIAAAGSLTRQQSRDDERMVRQVITEYREEKRRKRG
jgi:hypothetical protein